MPWHYQIAKQVISGMWIAWLVYWFIGAFATKRTIYRQGWRQQRPYFLITIICVAVVRLFPHIWSWRLSADPLLEIIGGSLCAVGLLFSVWARVHLGRNWSGMITLKENHELITSGPYAVVRHPIYTGICFALAASMLALQPSIGGLFVVCVMVLAFLIKLRQEEQLMMRQFPEQYPAYKSRVRAALIPFLV